MSASIVLSLFCDSCAPGAPERPGRVGSALGVDEADLVDLVAATAVEPGDLPAGRRGAGDAVGGGGAAGQAAPEVGGELGVEDSCVAVLLGLAQVRRGHVLAAAEREGGRG